MSKLVAHPQPFVLRTYSKGEICQLYNISPYILGKWVKAIEPEMGKVQGKTFSILQVQIFCKYYGVPGQVIRDVA